MNIVLHRYKTLTSIMKNIRSCKAEADFLEALDGGQEVIQNVMKIVCITIHMNNMQNNRRM